MAGSSDQLDRLLDKLVRDVEQAVHSLYRGDMRQQTAKARTDVHRAAARKALLELLGAAVPAGSGGGGGGITTGGTRSPVTAFAPPASGASNGGGALTDDEAVAITRCIMAWLPMGPPSGAAGDSRCVSAGKELIPVWADRERAREAIRRIAPKR